MYVFVCAETHVAGWLTSVESRGNHQVFSQRAIRACPPCSSFHGGGMGRTQNALSKDHEPADVDAILRECATRIRESKSVVDAWQILTGRGPQKLAWSDV